MKIKQFDDLQLYVRDEKDWGFWQNDNFEPEETELIKNLIKKDWTCLDVGANIGYFTVLMAKHCKLVRSYEPEFTNYQQLVKNILLNQTLNVLPSRIALTEHSGQGMLYLCPINNGMHRIYSSKWCNDAIIVKTNKLDNIWNELDRFEVNFIKMDTEGSELGILKGMKQMLRAMKPTIVMEYHPPSIIEYGANPSAIYQFMTDLGYDISLVNPNMPNISYRDLFDKTNNVRGGQNILCVQK